MISLAFLLLPPAAAAVLDVQSPAMRQLEEIEGRHPDEAPAAEPAKAGSTLGFSVKTLAPVGYLNADGNPAQAPAPTQPAPSSPRYIFEGRTPLRGVTVYTPKEDTGSPRSVGPPKEGMGGGLLLYGALGAGGLLLLIHAPLLFLPLAVVAVAALFLLNRKTA